MSAMSDLHIELMDQGFDSLTVPTSPNAEAEQALADLRRAL